MKKGKEHRSKKLRDDNLWATIIRGIAVKNSFGKGIFRNILS
jgi:hypothetical protein